MVLIAYMSCEYKILMAFKLETLRTVPRVKVGAIKVCSPGDRYFHQGSNS